MFDAAGLAQVSPGDDEARLVARIAELERAKAAAAAGQARCESLARCDAPTVGGRHLGFAKAPVYEMPHTLAALECGALSEWRARVIVRESACLQVEDRRTLDAEMCADLAELDGLGDGRIEAKAKQISGRPRRPGIGR